MKKLIALIVSLLMLSSVCAGFAEEPNGETAAGFDFTGYSYEELIGIKEQLDTELQTRPEAGERVLQVGQYVVGKRDTSEEEPNASSITEHADEKHDDTRGMTSLMNIAPASQMLILIIQGAQRQRNRCSTPPVTAQFGRSRCSFWGGILT